MIACWICHWGLCSSSLSGIKLAELMLEMHCYTSFHWKNTPKKKPWPSTAVKRPSTAVKRLPPLLCFLTVRQRAKGTVFEHCLQALQPSCKDTGSSGLKSAAAKLTLPLLPFSKVRPPATKEQKTNTDTDVCCIYNNVCLFIFWKHMVEKKSILRFSCLLSFQCTEPESCCYLSSDVNVWMRKNTFARRCGIFSSPFFTLLIVYIWQCSIKVVRALSSCIFNSMLV